MLSTFSLNQRRAKQSLKKIVVPSISMPTLSQREGKKQKVYIEERMTSYRSPDFGVNQNSPGKSRKS